MLNMANSVGVEEDEYSPDNTEPPDAEILPVETDPSMRYTRYEQILGRGAFKTVYKAFDEVEGIEIAWNQVRVTDLVSSPAERERLFAEIRVLKQLKHKNIMTFYDSWLDAKNLTVNFMTELFTSGTLRAYRKKHKHVDEQVLKRWAWQILQGLVYLHGHNPPIIHRDLKADNIFVNGSSGVIKIGDLGLATLWRGLTTPHSVLGTPEFMAPELYEEQYDEKVDVYSFGMCMLELATMEYPYNECKNAAQIYKKVMQGIPPAGLANVSNQELRDFIKLCICHDANSRPEARQLLKHPFFDCIRNLKAGCAVETNKCTVLVYEEPTGHAGDGSSTVSSDDISPKSHATQLINLAEISAIAENDSFEEDVAFDRFSRKRSLDVHSNSKSPNELEAERGFDELDASIEGNAGLSPCLSQSEDDDDDEDDGATYEGGNRKFFVNCEQAQENELSFELRFREPEGTYKTVEFTFDMQRDTAECIANEMMEDLSLSAAEAQRIASKITDEITRITSNFLDTLAASGGSPHQAILMMSPEQLYGVASVDLDARGKESVLTAELCATGVSSTNMARLSESPGQSNGFTPPPPNGDLGSRLQFQSDRQPVLQERLPSYAGSQTGTCTPPATSRGPSYHDLVKAMREFHELRGDGEGRGLESRNSVNSHARACYSRSSSIMSNACSSTDVTVDARCTDRGKPVGFVKGDNGIPVHNCSSSNALQGNMENGATADQRSFADGTHSVGFVGGNRKLV